MPPLVASPIGVETLDDPAADPAVVERMLGDIARANRWFGGARTVTRGLSALLDRTDRGGTVTLLDVGTGAGDLPRAARAWAAARGIALAPLGVERHRAAARLARASGMAMVVACGMRLPFGQRDGRRARGGERHDESRRASPFAPRLSRPVDIVLLSQLLHHFDDAAAIELLRAAHAAASRGVIVADLRPSRTATLLFRGAGRALRFAPVTIADGVTSLARGRPAAAVAALVRRAGGEPIVVRDLPMARVLVVSRSTGR